MNKVKEIQERLNANAAYQLDVFDITSGKFIKKALNQAYLDNKHNGQLIEYLNALKTKGLRKIQLFQKRKNGSSSITDGATVTVDFQENTNTPTAAPQATPTPHNNFSGLNGAFGLGMPEILDGYSAKRENEMLKAQLSELKAELITERAAKEKFRDEVSKLQRNNDIYEIRTETAREPSALDRLIEGIASNPSAIPALLAAFKGGGAGLASPETTQEIDESLSEIKQTLINAIPNLPDEYCELLVRILEKCHKGDSTFTEQLQLLLNSNNNG